MPTQVMTIAEAQPLFEQVVRWATHVGMRFHNLPLRVRLVPQSSRRGRQGQTVPQRLCVGRKLVRNGISAVEIVRGLDPVTFQCAAAHELGHVWLLIHRICLPLGLEEGFCEVVAYRFCLDQGSPGAAALAEQIARNPDPLYGGNFRRLWRALGEDGWRRILRERRFVLRRELLPIPPDRATPSDAAVV